MSFSNASSLQNNSLSLSDQLAQYGFYFLTDILVTSIYIPTCIISSLLSLVCVVVFYQREFKHSMYAYLRVYSVVNTILALVSIYSALTTPIQLFSSFANSYAANVYVAYVYEPVINLSYFFTTILDIAMLIDRISMFVPHLKPFCAHPYHICAFIFVGCLCIDFPFFFFYLPSEVDLKLNGNSTYRLYYVDYTVFAYSNAGRIIQYCQWAIRDILPVILICTCGIVSVILLNSHMKKRRLILKNGGVAKKTAIQVDSRSTLSITDFTNRNSGVKQTSRSNLRFCLLVYSISVLTTIQSVCSILALSSILLDSANILVTITNNVFNFFLVFKICCYFFIFYFLNTNFKKKIHSWK